MQRRSPTANSSDQASDGTGVGRVAATTKTSSASSIPPPSPSSDIKSLMKKPGEIIRSEDWNRLVEELVALRHYVNNMSESTLVPGLQSAQGREFEVEEPVGLITKQWLPASKDVPSVICSFGITDYFEVVQYWARADNGNKNTVDIIFEYDDGLTDKAGEGLFINSTNELRGRDPTSGNPYLEYLQSRSGNWYKYQLRNKFPNKEVRFMKFVNVNKECIPRIGNVLHLRSRLLPIS